MPDKINIPIMHCFDNNYVAQAGVAFYSMLKHADNAYNYTLYVLHTDITKENQAKLTETFQEFDNASIEFINMENKFEDIFAKLKVKGHYSKEVLYKMICASIFPQYDKMLVADVDVLYKGDISKSYIEFNTEKDGYLGVVKIVGKIYDQLVIDYCNEYPKQDAEKIKYCGGYLVMNLKKIRKDNLEEKFIECFQRNANLLRQAEMDVLNFVCLENVKYLPLNYLVCSYMWDIYTSEEDFKTDSVFDEKEIKEAMENPVQLHFATSVKPWNNYGCTKADEWFKILAKTPFLKGFLEELQNKISPKIKDKAFVDFSLKINEDKNFYIKIGRTKNK